MFVFSDCKGLFRSSRREMCKHGLEYGILHMPNDLYVYDGASGEFDIYTGVSEVVDD